MRVDAVVPVQEAFHVDLIADLEVLDSGVNSGGVVAEVGLNGELIGRAVVGNVEVEDGAVFAEPAPSFATTVRPLKETKSV